jgi:hypothetical protein
MRELFRDGVRWSVHEASAARTPGAQAYRCLIFDSEGIVRRLWVFPEHWDRLADDEILRLLDSPPTPAHGVRTVLHSGPHPTVIASIAAHVHAQELVAELMVVRDTSRALVEERRILLESCRQGREELRFDKRFLQDGGCLSRENGNGRVAGNYNDAAAKLAQSVDQAGCQFASSEIEVDNARIGHLLSDQALGFRCSRDWSEDLCPQRPEQALQGGPDMPGIFNHEDTDVRQIGGSGVERIAIICSGHANPRDLQTIFALPVCAHNPHTKISTCDAATRGKRLARTSSATMSDAGGLRRQDCVRKWIGLDHPTFHWFDAPVRTFRVDSRVRASIYRLAMVLVSLLLDAALGLAGAQTKLDAAYTATLWGLPVGHISWTVELGDNRFKAAARGAITGLLRIVADGRGDVAVHGAMSEGKPVPSLFSLNLIAGKWSDDVRIVFSGGKAQEHVAAAAVKAEALAL